MSASGKSTTWKEAGTAAIPTFPSGRKSDLKAVDPLTGEIRKTVHLGHPNFSGTLATGGGAVFLALLDGTVAAFDDTTLDPCGESTSGRASPRRR